MKVLNKRRSRREVCLVPVDGQKGSDFDNTKTVDLCKGGIGIISHHKIPLNKEITIALDLAVDQDPVFVVGKVKWIYPISESEFRLGVAFEEVKKGRTKLTKYFAGKEKAKNVTEYAVK